VALLCTGSLRTTEPASSLVSVGHTPICNTSRSRVCRPPTRSSAWCARSRGNSASTGIRSFPVETSWATAWSRPESIVAPDDWTWTPSDRRWLRPAPA
jgi:hypothetical protein